MENMESLAKANGFEMSDMIKSTVFIIDITRGPDVNAEYIKFFKDCDLPARSSFAVHQLPKGALVEIEAVFFKP